MKRIGQSVCNAPNMCLQLRSSRFQRPVPCMLIPILALCIVAIGSCSGAPPIEAPEPATAQASNDPLAHTVAGDVVSTDLERGKAYFTTCLACHGTHGEGNQGMHGPNLTKLDFDYLLLQMRNYRTYVRGGKDDFYGWQMNGRASALPGDPAVRDVIAFIQTLPDTSAAPTIKGDVEAGRTLYERHCESCHGVHGEGVAALSAPGLAGLDDWYQLQQLENYRKGIRGVADGDIAGKRMKPYAVALKNDQELRDVVSYIATFGEN